MADETKKLLDDLKSAFEQFKTRDAQTAEEQKKLGTATAETKTAIERVQTHMDELEKKLQRANLAATKGDDEGEETKATKAQAAAFLTYMRKGEDRLSPEETKALATDSDTDGGVLVPQNMSQRFLRKLIEVSPVRELATVETISIGDALEMVGEGAQNFDAGKVGQRGARPETQTGKLRKERIPAHEYYAAPHVTQTQLDDTSFDVEGWVSGRVGTRLAQIHGADFINGTGDGEPEGMLVHADVPVVNSGNAALLTPDGLIDLVFDLPEAYARLASFLLKRKTIRDIRKFKDTQGQYLWAPGINGGTGPTILGYAYREAVDMPEVAAGAFPILFGDFKAAYTIVDRQGIRVLRDPYTAKPFIEFYTTMRTGGQVVLAEALRKQKVSA